MVTHFFTASSLDGFIATPEHSPEWLFTQDFGMDGPWQYAPVTLGQGQPLLPRVLQLELMETVRNRSFVCGRYRVLGGRSW